MNELLSDPLLPFAFPFMQQAFLITLAVAVPMGLISALLVLKGWSLMGDAISHAVLPGVVIAYVIGLPLGAGRTFLGPHPHAVDDPAAELGICFQVAAKLALDGAAL